MADVLNEAAFKSVEGAAVAWDLWLSTHANVKHDEDPQWYVNNSAVAERSARRWEGLEGTARALLQEVQEGWQWRLTPSAAKAELDIAATVGFWLELSQAYRELDEPDLVAVTVSACKSSKKQLEENRLGQWDAIFLDAAGATLADLAALAQWAAENTPDDPRVTVGIGAAVAVAVVALFVYLR